MSQRKDLNETNEVIKVDDIGISKSNQNNNHDENQVSQSDIALLLSLSVAEQSDKNYARKLEALIQKEIAREKNSQNCKKYYSKVKERKRQMIEVIESYNNGAKANHDPVVQPTIITCSKRKWARMTEAQKEARRKKRRVANMKPEDVEKRNARDADNRRRRKAELEAAYSQAINGSKNDVGMNSSNTNNNTSPNMPLGIENNLMLPGKSSTEALKEYSNIVSEAPLGIGISQGPAVQPEEHTPDPSEMNEEKRQARRGAKNYEKRIKKRLTRLLLITELNNDSQNARVGTQAPQPTLTTLTDAGNPSPKLFRGPLSHETESNRDNNNKNNNNDNNNTNLNPQH